MNEENTRSLESHYATALQQEKAALQALQGHEPGTDGSTRAWQAWSEAITRTNAAWRELNSHTLSHHTHLTPVRPASSARGAGAPFR